MNDSGSAGPALLAAATPVSTKIPVPMMPPMPSSVSCVAVSARRSWLPVDSCSCSSAMDLVARSCRAMEPPSFREDSTQAMRGKRASTRARVSATRCRARARFCRPCALRRAQLLGHVRCEQLHERCVYLGTAGEDVPLLAVLGAAERADAPAGLLDEQRPGGGVPGGKPDLPERIDAPGRDIGQTAPRRPRAAPAGDPHRARLQHGEVR